MKPFSHHQHNQAFKFQIRSFMQIQYFSLRVDFAKGDLLMEIYHNFFLKVYDLKIFSSLCHKIYFIKRHYVNMKSIKNY